MQTNTLTSLSNELAGAAESIARSLVQVHGRRRPVSGVAHAADAVITSVRALSRGDGVRVVAGDGRAVEAELAGWDPASGLAVVRAPGLDLVPARFETAAARPGELALAAGRSWSNALTVSLGIVAVVGGPLRTGRGRSIEQIVRVTAPMHEGFAGGAVIGAGGALIGIATAAQIRGFGVVIPAALASKIAAHVLEHGRPRMGFLGIAGQTVSLPEHQRGDSGRDSALLVMGVTAGGPAEAGGVLVGDLILDVDGRPIRSVDDLLEGLGGDAVGKQVRLTILRGGATQTVTVTVAERPAS